MIETRFVPGLVYNNKKIDAAILKRFDEPSWNNPVVRFMTSDFTDIVSRKDAVWSIQAIASRMIQTLEKSNLEVPESLRLVALETSTKTEYATFAMHCYWEGEAQFGRLKGVKDTASAWLDGKEVVNVAFDPTVISYEDLVKTALKVRCASTLFVRDPLQQEVAEKLARDRVKRITTREFGKAAKASDQKYYLQGSPYRLLPMSRTQKTRVNSALGARTSPARFLSPVQVKMSKWIANQLEDKQMISELNKAAAEKNFAEYFEFVRVKVK